MAREHTNWRHGVGTMRLATAATAVTATARALLLQGYHSLTALGPASKLPHDI